MARKIKSVKPLIYVFCEGESEQAYTDFPSAVENSRKTVRALLSEGLPGIEDTDIRNQWLATQSKTFSNVYEAIDFLQALRN